MFHDDVSGRVHEIDHGHLSDDQVDAAVHDESPRIRCAIAESLEISEKQLSFLSYDDDSDVRGAVANSRHINGEIVRRLSIDSNPNVRRRIVQNPNLSLVSVVRLRMSDPDESVRDIAKDLLSPHG